MMKIIHTTQSVRRVSLRSHKNGDAQGGQSVTETSAQVVKPITAVSLVKYNNDSVLTPILEIKLRKHHPLEQDTFHPP